MLRCLGEDETALVLTKIYQGTCGIHIGERSLTHKLLTVYYYWPTLMKHSVEFMRKCDKCHKYSNPYHTLVETLNSITSPWPFYQRVMYILSHFPLAPWQMKFYQQKIIFRFGLPVIIILDNGTQFASSCQSSTYGQGGKTGLSLQAYPFFPHFFAGWAKVLGHHPLILLHTPFFSAFASANINIIFCNFRLKKCSSRESTPPRHHFFAGWAEVLSPQPQLYPSFPIQFFCLFYMAGLYGASIPIFQLYPQANEHTQLANKFILNR